MAPCRVHVVFGLLGTVENRDDETKRSRLTRAGTNKRIATNVTWALLLVARMLLVAPGITTRNKKLLVDETKNFDPFCRLWT